MKVTAEEGEESPRQHERREVNPINWIYAIGVRCTFFLLDTGPRHQMRFDESSRTGDDILGSSEPKQGQRSGYAIFQGDLRRVELRQLQSADGFHLITQSKPDDKVRSFGRWRMSLFSARWHLGSLRSYKIAPVRSGIVTCSISESTCDLKQQ